MSSVKAAMDIKLYALHLKAALVIDTPFYVAENT